MINVVYKLWITNFNSQMHMLSRTSKKIYMKNMSIKTTSKPVGLLKCQFMRLSCFQLYLQLFLIENFRWNYNDYSFLDSISEKGARKILWDVPMSDFAVILYYPPYYVWITKTLECHLGQVESMRSSGCQWWQWHLG